MHIDINKKAFTLMEIMIVIVILGIIASFALPNYDKAVKKAQLRDALTQLTIIHSANEMRNSIQGNYFTTASTSDLAAINTGLNSNIISNGLSYTYQGTATTWMARAAYGTTFTMEASQIKLSDGSSSPPNPCCRTAGMCSDIVADCP